MTADNTAKISHDEMISMFGQAMPLEAVTLLFNSPHEKTIGEIRAELRKIAKTRRIEAAHGEDILALRARCEELQAQNERLNIDVIHAKAEMMKADNRADTAEAEVERLTRERDDERSNHRRTVEAMEFEQRDTEAALRALAEGGSRVSGFRPPCDSDSQTSHQPAEGSPPPNWADHSEDR